MSSFQFPNLPQMDGSQQAQPSPFGFPQAPSFQQGLNYPGVPGFQPQFPGFQQTPFPQTPNAQLPFVEQSYIENILRLNRGKVATIYMNFENSQWGSKIFKGVIEAAGKDHIIISDPVTGMRYLLLTIYLNYITFDEEINYEYPFAVPTPASQVGTLPPIFNVPTPTPTPAPTTATMPTPNPTVAPYTQLRKKDSK